MARFEDFTQQEKHVIREAMEWAQPEFYDPGHAPEDRDTVHNLIEEIKRAQPLAPAPNPGRAAQTSSKTDVAPKGFIRDDHATVCRPNGGMERVAAEKPTRKVTGRPQLQPGEHTGFLYIECAHCGHIHAFCAKQPIKTYHCEECGGRTPLIDIYPLRVACECGARFNYKTNIVTQQMDVTCYHCGAPVAVEWSGKWQKYQPIVNQGGNHRSKKKKGGREIHGGNK